MQIFVIGIKGECYIFEVNLDDQLSLLRQSIFIKTKIEPDKQRLICKGKQLVDGKTLKENGIVMDSTIRLTLRLKGGGFNFSNLENMTEHEVEVFSDDRSPSFLCIGGGINIVVKCKNNNCDTQEYGGTAIICKKYGIVDIEKEQEKIFCPSCNQFAEIRTCGFFNCIYEYEGKLASNETKTGKGEADDKKYKEFSDNQLEMTRWNSLTFKVYKKPKYHFNFEQETLAKEEE